jgi:hypothetical protein
MSGMILDSDTLLLYRFEEAAATDGLTDESSNNYDSTLTESGATIRLLAGTTLGTRVISARSFGMGDAAVMSEPTDQYFTGAVDAALVAALKSAWTIEAWVNIMLRGSLACPIIQFSPSAANATEDGNVLAQLLVNSSGRIRALWEAPAETFIIATQTAGSIVPTGIWSHIAARKRSLGGGNYTVDFFLDGVELEHGTVGTLANASGGAAGTTLIVVGRDQGASRTRGFIDEIRVSSKERTNAEILESYTRGTTSSSIPPEVSNVSPSVGSQITPTTPISIDITDEPAGEFRRAVLHAAYSGLDWWEVIHNGDAFAPNYATGSSRTAITNGYRYSLLRRGGWPGSPTFTPIAIDTSGAENV